MSSTKHVVSEVFDKIKQAAKGVAKAAAKPAHKKGSVSTKRVTGGNPIPSFNNELPWVSKALQTPPNSKNMTPALPGSFAAKYQARTARSNTFPGTVRSLGDSNNISKSNSATFARANFNNTENQLNTLRKSNEVDWGNSFASNIETPTGNVADKLRAEGEYYRATIGAEPTKERQKELEIIQDIFSGKYSWGVTEDEFEKWQKENMIEKTTYNPQTGKREVELDDNGDPVMVFKKGATLPPIGRAEDGTTPDKAKLEKAWLHYNTVSEDMEIVAARKQRESTLMAGTDVGAADSLFDAVRGLSNEEFINGSTLKKHIGKYVTDYFIDPIKNGRWGALLMNALVNWGENSDFLGVGVRAMLSESDYVYGSGLGKGGHGKIFDGQEAWVSSLGKKKQKQLIELGAFDAMNVGLNEGDRQYRDKAMKAIREAGLYDDFMKFKDEYFNHKSDINIGSALKTAYHTNKNFNADTGNIFLDMATETMLDPMTWLGIGASSGVKAGSEAAVKGGINAGLKAVGKNADDVIKVAGKADKLTNHYVNTIGKHIFSTDFKVVEKDIAGLTNVLVRNKALTDEESRIFSEMVSKAVKESIDSKTFKIVKSMYYTNKVLDIADGVVLRASFAAPYLAYKLPTSAYKGARKVLAKTDIAEKFAYKKAQAAARVFEDMLDAEGNTSVTNLDELLERLSKEYVISEDTVFEDDVFRQFQKSCESGNAQLEQLINDINIGLYTVDELDQRISNVIEDITDGKCITKREFDNYMKGQESKFADRYGDAVSKILRGYTEQLKRLDDVVESFSAKTKHELLKEVKAMTNYQDVLAFKDDLLSRNSKLVKDVDLDSFVDLKLRALAAEANDDFTASVMLKTDIDNFVRDYEYRNSVALEPQRTSVIEHGPAINKPYTDDLLIADTKVPVKLRPQIKKVVDILNGTFNEEYDGAVKELRHFLFSSNYNTMDLQALREILDKTIFNIECLSVTKGWSLKLGDPVYDFSVLRNSIVADHYSVMVGKDSQIIKVHNDIYTLFDSVNTNKDFRNIINVLSDKKNNLGKLLNDVKEISLEGFDEQLLKVCETINDLNSQIELLNDFWSLKAKLDPNVSGLSEEQMHMAIDKAFGISLGAPEEYALGQNLDHFVDKIELSMNSLYGESKISLDGFRRAAKDFESDLYKRYVDEIQDPQIQERIKNICSRGHLDSRDDVRVQILQTILRDDGAIKYFNNLSEKQAVLFTDIETLGLNKDLHQISSIAYKQWETLSEDATLDEILTFLEGDVKYQQSYLSDDFIDSMISDDILELCFKNDPKVVKTREAMLDAYKDKFSAVRNGKAVSEKDILSAFMYDLDGAYLKHQKQVPVIVTHNNNGFDMKYLSARISKEQEFPVHVVHLQDLINNGLNTFVRLKSIEKDGLIFTEEQRKYVQDTFRPVFEKLSKKGSKVKFFDPSYFSYSIFNLKKQVEAFKTVSNGLEDVSVIDTPAKIMSDIMTVSKDSVLTDLTDMMNKVTKDLTNELKVFKNNYIFKPDYSSSEGIDNLLKRSMQLNPDAKVPALGYDIVSDSSKISQCFSGYTWEKLPISVYETMTNFAKSVENTVRYSLKENDLLIRYLPECQKFIDYFRDSVLEHILEGNDLYYLKFLKTPESANEAYAVARKLYQEFWDTANDIKFKMYPTEKEKNQVSFRLYKSRKRQVDGRHTFEYTFDSAFEALLSGSYDNIVMKASSKKYIDKFKTPLVERAFDLRQERAKAVSNLESLKKTEDRADFIFSEDVDDIPFGEDTRRTKAELEESKAAYISAQANLNTKTTLKNVAEDANVTDVKDYRVRETYELFLDTLDYLESAEPETLKFYSLWSKVSTTKRREVFTAQILKNITKSENDLVSHLLFHNQFLVIPRAGNDLHKAQVEELLQLLSGDLKYVEHTEDSGYIFIGLKKDVKMYIKDDTRFSDTEASMRIGDDVFYAPKYERISIGEFDEDQFKELFLEEKKKQALAENRDPEKVKITEGDLQRLGDAKDFVEKCLVPLDEQINVLTRGATTGSLGILHNLNRQKELYKILPTEFAEKVLTDEYTCNARLWHQGSFDMSILGDSENCWKFGNADDTDMLYNMSRALEEAAGKAVAERSYLEHFFGKNADSRMSNLLSELSPKEKVAFLKNNPDQVVVSVFANKKTASGFEVKALKVNDEYGVKAAEASNAVVVPYDVYVDMVGTLNNSTISNTALKLWTKALALTKVGHLANLGTWLRNYLDATVKATGNSGSLVSTLSGQAKAIQLYTRYNKIVKFVDKVRGITYKSDKDIERMFRQGIIQSGTGVDMTYEQFHWMEGLMRESVMGGESAITKSILQVTQISGNRNVALKAGRTDTYAGRKATKEAYDLIASDLEKFTNLEVSEVKGLCDDLPYNVFMENGFTRESFLETFEKLKAGVDDMSDEAYQHFAEVQNRIIKERSDRLVGIDRGANRMLDKLCNAMLHPMSYVEQIIRLGEYITLEEQGYARSEIFKKITDSQFDYSLKSNSTKVWEMLIPYYNFDTLNLVYWCKQVSENPRMLRYLEHVWGTLSWDAAFEIYDDKDTPDKNMSVQYMALNGGIPIGNNGMYFKANPSFLSALNWFYGGPNNYLSKLATPLQYLARHGMDAMGADAWHIFDDIDTDFSDEPVWEQALNSTPIAGTMYTRYFKHFFAKDITIDLGAPYAKDQIKIVNKVWKRIDEGHTFQEALVFAMPTVFGAVKRYQEGDRDGFELFQMQLKAQGKWYDANRGKVVSLDEYNEEGLNSPSMAWDQLCTYRARYHNEFWDSNKNKFVPANEFTVGGLNRKFDFEKNPDDWDEYCRLRKLYRNEEWDNNQRKFVTPDRYIEGKLNAKGLTPEEVFYYNELFFGTKMDLNQGVLVKYEDYIEGGLNSDNLTWNELCAYKYALHGEKWVKGKGWVKVREPIIEFSIPESDDTSTTKVRRDGNILESLGLVSIAYAGNAANAEKNKDGKYVLSKDIVKNADIFAAILAQYGGVGQSSRNYYYGNAGGYRHRAYHKYSGYHRYAKKPKNANGVGLNEPFSNARSSGQGVNAGGKTYSKPYSFNNGLAGLRMAASGYNAYDEYYKQEYEYNYKYRNPIKDVADYPQTKLGIQRYLKGRSENLERKFRNRMGSNVLHQNNNQRLSTKENLNNMKLSWWNRY